VRQDSTHVSLSSRFRQREAIRELIVQSGSVNHRSARSEFNRNPFPGPYALLPRVGWFRRLVYVRAASNWSAIGAKFGDRFLQAFCPGREWFPVGSNAEGIAPALWQVSEGSGDRDNFSHDLRIVAVPQPLWSLIARRIGMDHE
jgi:hypothetical protein